MTLLHREVTCPVHDEPDTVGLPILAEGGLRRLPETDCYRPAQMGGPGSPSLFGSGLIRQLLDLGGGSGSLLAVSPYY